MEKPTAAIACFILSPEKDDLSELLVDIVTSHNYTATIPLEREMVVTKNLNPRNWLRQARLASKWPTQTLFAKEVGVSPLAVLTWETGAKMPSWEHRQKLALLLGDHILTKFHDEERAELALARQTAA